MSNLVDLFSKFLNQFGFGQLILLAIVVFIFLLVVFCCIYVAPYLVYKDAKRREMNAFFWAAFHFIGFLSLFFPGLLIQLYYRFSRNPIGGETEETVEYEEHKFKHPNQNRESERFEDDDLDLDEAFEEY
jgi:hypothetical protein